MGIPIERNDALNVANGNVILKGLDITKVEGSIDPSTYYM
jgi:hypothetical protein